MYADDPLEVTAAEAAELEEFSKASGVPFDDVINRWIACSTEGAGDPIDCAKSRETPVWLVMISQDPITDEIQAGVINSSIPGVNLVLACSGLGEDNSVFSISTAFFVEGGDLEVVTRIDKAAARSEDPWSASPGGMGIELRNRPAKDLISALSEAEKLAYRIHSPGGGGTQVIDVSKFSSEAKSVIEVCGW